MLPTLTVPIFPREYFTMLPEQCSTTKAIRPSDEVEESRLENVSMNAFSHVHVIVEMHVQSPRHIPPKATMLRRRYDGQLSQAKQGGCWLSSAPLISVVHGSAIVLACKLVFMTVLYDWMYK